MTPETDRVEAMNVNLMVDMEISLVKAFTWSLKDIDETDIESLIPFMLRFSGGDGGGVSPNVVYCDQVDWL